MVASEAQIREWLTQVTDPEIPVLTIEDLGILRDVRHGKDGVTVTITPTYSGCPAMMAIRMEIVRALREQGVERVRVEEVLSPAWTTDWLSQDGRAKLLAYGIAPPAGKAQRKSALFGEPDTVACPQCGSERTSRTSEFGSTACKAMYRCEDCLEPFDYFKCI
ncbi:1,2-phenylacetyl-CoA epoxidase subunit PaaD [Aquisalimonas sp.]|uniref:1,2-phenylacetyl-CoA epoxidase subunit PaaD n=1 Tax=unclassified Aquisalimonas TaxID=2644645 RepID=UPI0025BC6305|nr:1,2-phenylacetyl-CoA epoxidase subunit PaaD [Aquisalimonas sp.]